MGSVVLVVFVRVRYARTLNTSHYGRRQRVYSHDAADTWEVWMIGISGSKQCMQVKMCICLGNRAT